MAHKTRKIYNSNKSIMALAYKTPSYDGVAIAVIPIENANHICWVLQMCLRHGLDLKCAIFTDQGPMLAAAALLYDNFKIKLKLQLCLQHTVCCICRLYSLLFQTRRDNNRSSPDSGKNKSKALIKSTGKQNDQI